MNYNPIYTYIVSRMCRLDNNQLIVRIHVSLRKYVTVIEAEILIFGNVQTGINLKVKYKYKSFSAPFLFCSLPFLSIFVK